MYDGRKGERAQRKVREELQEERPINKESQYASQFPHWQNGKCDVFIEKCPQFPYYQEPFRGKTAYAQSFSGDKMKELKDQQKRVNGD